MVQNLYERGDKEMRKNFGKQTWLYPLPVLIVGTYDKDGKPNAMNAAWGGIYDTNQIMLCLSDDHKTTKNIRKTGAFTVSVADAAHAVAADYVGIASGNDVADKMERAGFHTAKSEFVNAPVIDELPVTLECRLVKFNEDGIVVGDIVNVSAAERVLDADGNIDPAKVEAITFDPVRNTYIKLGETVGCAFSDGLALGE